MFLSLLGVVLGQLKASPVLGQRLQAAESELARLDAAQRVAPVSLFLPNVRERFLGMLTRLGDVLLRDPERGREELRQVLEGAHPPQARRGRYRPFSQAARCGARGSPG